MKEIRKAAKDYFDEYVSGAPLTEESVIESMVDFYVEQHKLFLAYIESYINVPPIDFGE